MRQTFYHVTDKTKDLFLCTASSCKAFQNLVPRNSQIVNAPLRNTDTDMVIWSKLENDEEYNKEG